MKFFHVDELHVPGWTWEVRGRGGGFFSSLWLDNAFLLVSEWHLIVRMHHSRLSLPLLRILVIMNAVVMSKCADLCENSFRFRVNKSAGGGQLLSFLCNQHLDAWAVCT